MKSTKETQINFPIEVKSDNSVDVIKKSFNKTMIKASVVPFYRSFPYVLSMIFTFLTFIFLAIQTYQYYNTMPYQIPLIYSQSATGWQMVDKESLLVFLALFLLFSIVIPYLNSKIYFFDKRLVVVMSIGIVILDCFVLIAFSEIFSLLH